MTAHDDRKTVARTDPETASGSGPSALRWIAAIAAIVLACVGNALIQAGGERSTVGIVLVAIGGIALILVFVRAAMGGIAARGRGRDRTPGH